MASGSPLWQTIFLSFALVLILFEVVRGWRLGLMRQLVRAAAIVVAYLSAIFGGKLVLPLVRSFLKVPDIVISILAGAILALVVYAALVTIGSILFKRTGQQKAGVVRLLYGLCGAVAGIFFGLFSVWLIVLSIRALGAIANAQLQTHTAQHATRPPQQASRGRPAIHSLPTQSNEPTLVNSIAKLKNSLELGPVGDVVKGADVVPASTYETLGKVGQVFSNPESAARFLSCQGAKALTENPKIVALRDDPEIMRMIEDGRFLDLLHDPRIIDAVNDPVLAAQVKSFEFEKALDYAVRKR
jgi:membrane protein required for colicin V production